MTCGYFRSAVPGLLMVLASVGAASGAPITFNTALPVAMGEFMARQQILFTHAGRRGLDRTARIAVSVLGYGVNSDLTLFGVIPYVSKDLKLTMSQTRISRHADGLGDMKFFVRYTVYKNNFRGGNFRIAPFAGLKLPTGSSNRQDTFGRLPPALQPGSGSWDPFGGIVITYQTLEFQIDSEISYRANSSANGFKSGDVARLNASVQYRLWPRELRGGVPGFLYGVLETNLVNSGNNRVGGIDDMNSGGTRLFLVPGLQYVTRRWIAEVAIQLPIIQNLNGIAPRNDYMARGGFRFNF